MKTQWCKRLVAAGVLAILAGVALWLPPGAQAVPITFNFTGINSGLSPSLAGGPVATGDTLTGSYTFESTTVGTGGGCSAVSGQCDYFGAITALNFTVGSYTGTGNVGDTNIISVLNDFSSPMDAYTVVNSFTGASINGFQPDIFFFVLVDPSTAMFSGTALPTAPPSLIGIGNRNFQINYQNNLTGQTGFINGSIISLTAVPEPPTAWLFGLGIGLLALWKVRARCMSQAA